MSVYSARSDVAAVLSAALQLLVIAQGHILCFICICILGSALRDNIKIHQKTFHCTECAGCAGYGDILKGLRQRMFWVCNITAIYFSLKIYDTPLLWIFES